MNAIKLLCFLLLSAKISGNLCHLLYKFRSPANATQTLNKRAQLDKHLTALMLGAQAHHTAQCDCATVMREYASTRVCTVFDAKTNYSHLGAAHTKPLPRVEFNQPNNTNAHSTPTIRGHRHTHSRSRRERSKLNHLSAFGGALTHTPLFPFTHSVFVVLNYTLSQSQAPTSRPARRPNGGCTAHITFERRAGGRAVVLDVRSEARRECQSCGRKRVRNEFGERSGRPQSLFDLSERVLQPT